MRGQTYRAQYKYGAAAGDPYSFITENAAKAASRTYDYIIVGGGSAGCPLGATLSINHSVLVVERGRSPYGVANIENQSGFPSVIFETDEYSSVAQTFVSEDGVEGARARVLGGGSAIGTGSYSRASLEYIRKMGWDEKLVNESYDWVERELSFRPCGLGPWQLAVKDALLEMGALPFNGFTFDHIEGTKIGALIFDDNGKRHTAADLLKYGNPDNIVVLLNATTKIILFHLPAHQIMSSLEQSGSFGKGGALYMLLKESLFTAVHAISLLPSTAKASLNEPKKLVMLLLLLSEENKYSKPRAQGVEFVDTEGIVRQVFLKQSDDNHGKSEVILSAGALGSPQLLLLSGIGPAEHLKDFNIIPLVDMASVGQGMADNPENTLNVLSPQPLEASMIHVMAILNHSQTYIQASSQVHEITPNPNDEGDNSQSKLYAYIGAIYEKVAYPLSRGELRLRSLDPRDNPAVRFNYYSHPQDIQRCIQGLRISGNLIFHSNSLQGFVYRNASDIPDYLRPDLINIPALPENYRTDDAAMADFCRDTLKTMCHYHGGCNIGSVINKRYQVMGVEGLRIVDSSTFESCPGTNPQATAMMLGRYADQKEYCFCGLECRYEGLQILRERLSAYYSHSDI
eukprot:Gb_30675 [translate_table: standard]